MFLRIIIAFVAVIVGLFIGTLCNMGIGMLNILFFPMPADVNWCDESSHEALDAWIKSLPQHAFILVVVAHQSQSFIGAIIAAFIAKRNMMCVAMVVGVLSTIAGLMNLLTIHGPVWLWLELPLYLASAWIGAKLVIKMRSK